MVATDNKSPSNDATAIRDKNFWALAMLIAPVITFVLPLLAVQLAGGFENFVWVDVPITFLQSLGILGAMLFPVGAFLYARCGWFEALARVSQTWPTTPGSVTSSAIKSRSSGLLWPPSFYRLAVSYRFHVDDSDYEGDRVQFGLKWVSTDDLVNRFAESYPAGAQVSVHYCPEDPETCVIETAGELAWCDMRRIWAIFATPIVLSVVVAIINSTQ